MGLRIPTCRYNVAVDCPTCGPFGCAECETCGWNPVVEKARKQELREKIKRGENPFPNLSRVKDDSEKSRTQLEHELKEAQKEIARLLKNNKKLYNNNRKMVAQLQSMRWKMQSQEGEENEYPD